MHNRLNDCVFVLSDFIFGHVKHYEVVCCLLQKIYRQQLNYLGNSHAKALTVAEAIMQ